MEYVVKMSSAAMVLNLDFEHITQYSILFGDIDSFLTYLEIEMPMVGKNQSSSHSSSPTASCDITGVGVPEMVEDQSRVWVKGPCHHKPAWSEA